MQWIDGHLQYHPASGIWSSTPTICMLFYLSIDPNKGIGEPRIWIWTFTCFQLKGNEKSLKEEPLGAIWILQEANIEDNGEIKWTLDLCIRWMDGQSCQDNLPGNCPISGVASCLISSALAMRQLPQQLLQIWNGALNHTYIGSCNPAMVIIVIVYLNHG